MGAIQKTGKALPCTVVAVSGQIVTVNFEVNGKQVLPQVTMPIIGAEYVRFPTQVGDKGVSMPADVYLGGVSGLGGGTAGTTQYPNLATLFFIPLGNTGFFSVNPNAVVIYGPDGVVLQNTAATAELTLLPISITMMTGNSVITMTENNITFASPTLTFDGEVTGNAGTSGGTWTLVGPLNVTNDVTAGTVSLENHLTSQVEAGGGTSGPPVAGT